MRKPASAQSAPRRPRGGSLVASAAVIWLAATASITWAQAPATTPTAPGTEEGTQPAAGTVTGIVPGTGPNAVVPPITPSAPVIAAKTLFGAAKTASKLEPRALGYYSKGCLAGGQRLAVDGPEWQTMRLSRNRSWGHPALISFLERFASDARRLDGWPGLLVGDMSQPRGGPMLTGHASHQVGLDADLWLMPMPDRRLTKQEREDTSATNMLAPGGLAVDPKVWTDAHLRVLKRAASFGEVERIFVHPAIKKALCEATATSPDRLWLHKVRPMWGHDHHFHVRLGCPAGTAGCQIQPPTQADDGCGKELTEWYALLTAPPKPPTGPPAPPPPPLTLDKLPAECRDVLSDAPTTLRTSAPK
jgi:penicillin-insensitive murein DD-endopeptidase